MCVESAMVTSKAVKENVNNGSTTKQEPYLNPSLQDVIPPLGVTSEGENTAELVEMKSAPWDSRQLIFNDNVNLKWVQWSGGIPSRAVSIWNGYTSRTDYVCATSDCAAGFYSTSKGSYCYYPYGDKEFRTSSFKILVNEDNFESLEWRSGSYGSIPENSISTCSGASTYVGKNKYGLGKVVPRFKAFFLPYNGYEYWYKYYDVLRVYKNYHTQKISNVHYLTSEAHFNQGPPFVLTSTIVTNNDCQSVKQTVSLSKATLLEQRWDIGRSTSYGVTATISTGIPIIDGTSVSFSAQTTFDWKKGTTRAETITHELSIELEIPPNYECEVVMEGKQMTADIPYTATLTRYYNNGETRSTYIRENFNGVQVQNVKAEVKRCQPISNADPCPAV
nr:PREDICTED: natterin-3-like [Latimeria chalumnae]|eukprot:XP_006007686.2 PREDICTED: natterin-3-like [Latimeria chalumnae]